VSGAIRLNGWVILDKPHGLGSTQAVSAIKRGLRDGGYAKVPTGHGGTLDPLATGVLPIALGEGTKLAGRMLDATKDYDFTVAFGTETDTLDLEAAVVATSEHRPTRADIESVLLRFTGPIEQRPPAYSAIKLDGRRAYDRARSGEVVEMPARAVNILTLSVRHAELDSASIGRDLRKEAPAEGEWTPDQVRGDCVPESKTIGAVTLSATVSKGTYIRSLARDIALGLGTVGHVTMLRRTRAGPFGLGNAISLDNWADAAKARELESIVLPIEAGLDGIPALPLTPGEAEAIRQGRVLAGSQAPDGLHFAKLGDTPIALVEAIDGNVRVVRGFNL